VSNRPTRFVVAVACLAVTAAASACTQTAGSCGSSATDTYQPQPVPPPSDSGVNGGQAFFDWSHGVSGLCTKAPDSATYVTFQLALPSAVNSNVGDVTVTGQVYTSALLQPYTAAVPYLGTGAFLGTVSNVGLAQADATMITDVLHLTFPSSGNFAADTARMHQIAGGFFIATTYEQAPATPTTKAISPGFFGFSLPAVVGTLRAAGR